MSSKPIKPVSLKGFTFVMVIGLGILFMLMEACQPADLAKRLRKDHPRLIFTVESQQRIEKLASEDALLQQSIKTLVKLANQMISQPSIHYKLEGPRLLSKSRDCLSKVMTLSLAYRLSGDLRYAQRARVEMLAAAGFPDWNPDHFLDVAEMSTALALGYDWLFEILSDEDRRIIRTALIEKGLKPGLQEYPDGFAKKINNWNFVCNGGMIMAALAIADEEPDLAQEVINRALESLPVGLESFAPDGAWFEGPSYWMYGTNYLAMLLSSLESALGTDYGISASPGLRQSGHFYLSSIGPSGNFFNYSDCRLNPMGPTPALFWLAGTFDEPFFAEAERQVINSFVYDLDATKYGLGEDHYYYRFYPLEIAWYDPRSTHEIFTATMDSYFRGLNDVVYFRTSWEEDAFFVGFKAGQNGINHGHLDCGSFVLEALGERWAEDLGSDDYNRPGYFEYQPDGERWNYFRNSSISHNVLTINEENQVVDGSAKLIAFTSNPELASAVIDLSDAYTGQAKSVQRGIAMLGRRHCLIQDEVVGLEENDTLRWAMLPSADIALDGNRAVLTKGGEHITVQVLDPGEGHFIITPTLPTYHQDEETNVGTYLLTLSLPMSTTETTRLVIMLTPHRESADQLDEGDYDIIPLSSWAGHFTQVEK
jgi:hypothetical protein